ncbi:MAG: UDP-N-acetylmuramate--L-alanine ligase [Roseburia sp.]|nr:UDP-N-acetylmuramate--L-alanine ligase [Roseburia sp.]
MYNIDFNHSPGSQTAYFIGIGGISMSGFAELLQTMGFTVRGSDRTKSKITKHLEELGIKIVYEQTGKNITQDIDFVVYTAAIAEDNPEFVRAKELGLPMMERADMVGQVMKNYPTAVAVSGTHGKTSTTSIASHILLAAGMDPTISVGGILPEIAGNIRVGQSETFITEACEYTNSFLKFFPTIGIILNIEAEHLDFFKDLEDIRNSFRRFASLIPADGTLIINADIERVQEITDGLACKVLTYSADNPKADFSASDITFDEKGCGSFTLLHNGRKEEHYQLNVVGKHNISNALSCLALASVLNIPADAIQCGLAKYKGTERRFERKGEYNGAIIIDDYAHHPTEIRATLTSARNYPHKTLWVAFQPHTYSRTKNFLEDFAEALSLADHVILADIYAAREKDPGDISSEDVAEQIRKLGKDALCLKDFQTIEKFFEKNLMNGDLLITMGAGNIVEVGESLINH